MLKKYFIKMIKLSIFVVLIAGISLIACDYLTEQNAKGKVYNSTQKIPSNKVGLLLGTAKYVNNGKYLNLYYKYRINAAVKLYQAGKIKYILVSGDNSSEDYDEPTTMKEDLIARGIPSSRIILDYAGFRTLDSIVRAKKVFGQDKLTIISQQFHNERALYLAQDNEMEAVAFNAKSVKLSYGFRIVLRERMARVKMFFDIFVGVDPKFLGDKIQVG